jgi:hypothetical protein
MINAITICSESAAKFLFLVERRSFTESLSLGNIGNIKVAILGSTASNHPHAALLAAPLVSGEQFIERGGEAGEIGFTR